MKSEKLVKKVLIAIFLGVICWNVGSVVGMYWPKYSSHTYWQQFPSLQKTFLSSQYVNKNPKGWIPDEGAFSYAAGMYIKGINPVLIVPDAPPLGKYIIGFSIFIFNNENDLILISAVLSLVLMYIVGLQIFKNSLIALLPPLFFSSESIFKNQLIYTPLLDLFQLAFFLGSICFFNLAMQKKSHQVLFFILAGVCVGCFMSTKFFVSGLPILITWFIVIALERSWQSMFSAFLGTVISMLLVPLSYIRVFAFGYSLKAFLGIQKWVFLYHKSQLILPFSVWPLLLMNRWYVWFGNKPYITDSQWNITWPILVSILFLTSILFLFKKITYKKEIGFLVIWSFVYLLQFSFGEIFSRYFVILIPILYIIAVYFFQQVFFTIKHR